MNTPPAMQQQELSSAGALEQFWRSGHFASFQGVDDIRINYAQFVDSEHSRSLVISPGRCEGYLKYQELAFDLYQQGYNLFIIDHRGQGISQRMLDNRYKGYVKNFDDYANDLQQFIDGIVMPKCQSKPYLLAHSMGSTIALRYLQQHPDTIRAVVLSSPMIAFNTGAIPLTLTSALLAILAKVNRWCSNEPWYFIGQQDYRQKPFIANPLTHSSQRYQQFIALYQQIPELQLGGVTIHWMQQALQARRKIFAEMAKLTVPIQVLQSGADTVVDNEEQNIFCQRLHALQQVSCPGGQPIVIEGALHELFIEQDDYRQQALTAMLDWFSRH